MDREFDDYCGVGTGFREWLVRMNKKLEKLYGLGVFDLPDQTWRDWYEDMMTYDECIAEMKESGDIW